MYVPGTVRTAHDVKDNTTTQQEGPNPGSQSIISTRMHSKRNLAMRVLVSSSTPTTSASTSISLLWIGRRRARPGTWMIIFLVLGLVVLGPPAGASAFVVSNVGTSAAFRSSASLVLTRTSRNPSMRHHRRQNNQPSSLRCRRRYYATKQPDGDRTKEEIVEEEARIRIYQDRRRQIRQVLRAADSVRQFRWQNGYVPDLDPVTGKPVQSDGKVAVAVTAFVVAAGAIALRIGGRAALVSAVGLDFLADSPELKENLEAVLTTADTMNVVTKLLLFALSWTAVKVLCFDAGGVVLALASGILFGGVIEGAVASAASATLGSCVAYGIAQLDTPVRKQALQLMEDYPSLRGIEKVVARDGLKAVLTLRLAPLLPIPIGLYNYVYGVTNIPLGQFAGGIFLGSLKPYLLDSYLGYFGKEVIQGQQTDPLQDFLLVGALGVSVLIGVFASQLAAETWESVLQEIEEEKKAKAVANANGAEDEDDDILRNLFGMDLPEWVVGFQLALRQADIRVNDMIAEEYEAQLWNSTATTKQPILSDRDPALKSNSLEVVGAYKGIDLAAAMCDGLVLSPLLFGAFLKYANPLYDHNEDKVKAEDDAENLPDQNEIILRQHLLNRLEQARRTTRERMAELDQRIRQEGNSP